MADQHPNENGGSKKTILAEELALQAMPELPQQHCRARDPCEPQAAEQHQATDPAAGEARGSDWQTVALWIFVAVSFAAFLFAGYLLWVKCRGVSPF